MSQLPHARSFKDLAVYQKAKTVAKQVFELTKRFSKRGQRRVSRIADGG
jgi:hypothetical protein